MSESSDDSVLEHMFDEYHAKNMNNEIQDSSSDHITKKDSTREKNGNANCSSNEYQKGRSRLLGHAFDSIWRDDMKNPSRTKMRRRDSSKELPAISLRDSVCTIENVVTKMRQEIVDCELNYPENKQCAELIDETLKHIKSSLHLAAKLLKLSPSCSDLENHKKARGKYKTFTPQQEEVLYEYFSKTIRPTQPLIEHIAKKLEADKARVNRWFINQRHKQNLWAKRAQA